MSIASSATAKPEDTVSQNVSALVNVQSLFKGVSAKELPQNASAIALAIQRGEPAPQSSALIVFLTKTVGTPSAATTSTHIVVAD